MLYVERMHSMRRQINYLQECTLRSTSERERGCLSKDILRQMIIGRCAREQEISAESKNCSCHACNGRAPSFTAPEKYDYVTHFLHLWPIRKVAFRDWVCNPVILNNLFDLQVPNELERPIKHLVLMQEYNKQIYSFYYDGSSLANSHSRAKRVTRLCFVEGVIYNMTFINASRKL